MANRVQIHEFLFEDFIHTEETFIFLAMNFSTLLGVWQVGKEQSFNSISLTLWPKNTVNLGCE